MNLSQRQKNMTRFCLGIYLFLLTWLILFKFAINIQDLPQIRSINFIPYGASATVNGHIDAKEIIYNMLVFVPLGVYVQMIKPDWPFFIKLLPSFCLSFLFESLQYIFSIGASDITDLIDNTLGGMIGIGFCIIMKKLFKKSHITVINMAGFCIEFFAFTMIALLSFANRS